MLLLLLLLLIIITVLLLLLTVDHHRDLEHSLFCRSPPHPPSPRHPLHYSLFLLHFLSLSSSSPIFFYFSTNSASSAFPHPRSPGPPRHLQPSTTSTPPIPCASRPPPPSLQRQNPGMPKLLKLRVPPALETSSIVRRQALTTHSRTHFLLHQQQQL